MPVYGIAKEGPKMKLATIAERIGAELLAHGVNDSTEIDHVYASDRMSDLLNGVANRTLLVTNLSHVALTRFIELMDVPAICLSSGAQPAPTLLAAASAHGTVILVSRYGMYETCGRLFELLNDRAGETET